MARGVSDAELGGINVPVTVTATDVPNLFHQYRTVDQLVALIPTAVRLDVGFPESLRPDFVGILPY